MSAALPPASLVLEVRELIARNNRCLDARDADGFLEMFTDEGEVIYGGERTTGAQELRRFVDRHGSTDAVTVRRHVGNVELTVDGEEIHARSFAMTTQLVDATSPDGDGSPNIAWAGYCEAVIVRGDRLRFSRRLWHPWRGDVLSGFPVERGEE